VHKLIRDAASVFLRGETYVIDFTYAFRRAMDVVIDDRPLVRDEVRIFNCLERWEASGWSGRPMIVDQLRALVASSMTPGEERHPA
jgi:hypothetical protein